VCRVADVCHRAGWLADSEQSAALGRLVAARWLDRLLPEVRRILMRRRLITGIEQVAGPPNVPAKQPGGQAADADDDAGESDPGRSGTHVCGRALLQPPRMECGKVSRSSTAGEVRTDSGWTPVPAWRSL
jgi:hypothetical protein